EHPIWEVREGLSTICHRVPRLGDGPPAFGSSVRCQKQPTCPEKRPSPAAGTGWRGTTRCGSLRVLGVKVWPGAAYPLGATWDGAGVNFALFSEHATSVELCLFDDAEGNREVARVRLEERDDQVWHCYLPEARP